MTALTDTQVITASGGLVELGYFESASAVNLDPTTTTVVSAQTIVSDGSPLLLEYYSRTCYANNADLQAQVGFSVDGAAASTDGFFASPATGLYRQPFHIQKRVTLAAGSHTIAVQGFRNAGLTIMGLDGPMFLRVSKIVQATQWPAVTTGTIICTSTTRPASPFEGQTIYETDTDRKLVWNASAWVAPQVVSTPPMCITTGINTSQTLAHGSFTNLQFTGADTVDTDNIHNPASNSDQFVIATAGVYSVGGSLIINSTAVTALLLAITKNGSGQAEIGSGSPLTASAARFSVSGITQCVAGDVIRLSVYQESTSSGSRVPFSGRMSLALLGKP